MSSTVLLSVEFLLSFSVVVVVVVSGSKSYAFPHAGQFS